MGAEIKFRFPKNVEVTAVDVLASIVEYFSIRSGKKLCVSGMRLEENNTIGVITLDSGVSPATFKKWLNSDGYTVIK